MAHVVWDWNGTLFDDIDAVVAAANEIFAPYGLPAMGPADFRSVYTRPIWACYELIMGRPLEDGEWERLDAAFHDSYHRQMKRCGLATDARDTIDSVAGAGHTQSLLSMGRHTQVDRAVRDYGFAAAFRRVDGRRPGQGGGSKSEFMLRHLGALGVEPADVVMVGDSVDDAEAARNCGARAILYAGGMQARAALDRVGVPVIERLTDVPAHI